MSVLSRLGVAARVSSFLRQPFARGYGSAVAAQFDYDYYYHDDSDKESRGVMEESDGRETPGRGVQWVIMGDPTVRRHLYADRLAKLLDVPHISMGSLVRQEMNVHSPLYKQVANAVNEAKLVPEDVIFGLLSKRLEEGYCRGETGFILDGIPRTRMQAEILDQIAEIDLVLNLKCPEESFSMNTSGNSLCSSPQEMHSGFNVSDQPPTSQFQSASIDSDVIWKEKLRMYAEQRKPLEEYYKRQKKLLDFQVSGGSGDAWHGLLAALQLQHMNAVDTSHKLTA